MKRDDQTPTHGGEDFAEKVREQLHRGADVARTLIARLRSLLGESAPEAPRETPPPRPAGTAPRRGGDAWEPRVPAPAPAPAPAPEAAPEATHEPDETPRFRDEEGEESSLPVEFATTTMGHVLLAQGRLDDARRIFRAVLARHADDAEARRALDELVGRSTNGDPSAVTDVPPGAENAEVEPFDLLDRSPPPWGYGVSEARALPVDPSTIVVFWELTEDALARAGETTGWGALRSLCVVSMWSGTRGLERVERYVDDVSQLGDWFVTGLPPGATHHAAVGLRRGGRFVPIVHATPIATPRGRPAPMPARVRATVAIPARHAGLDAPPRPRIVTLLGPRDALAEATARLSVAVQTLDETRFVEVDAEVFERAERQWRLGPPESSPRNPTS